LVGIIGSVQALETIKVIIGFGESLNGYLLVLDAANIQWQKFKLNRNPDCPVCGDSDN